MTDLINSTAFAEIARSIWISNGEVMVQLEDGAVVWPGGESGIVSRATQAIYSVCYTGAKRRTRQSLAHRIQDWLVEEVVTSVRSSQELDWAWCIEQINQNGSVRARRGGRVESFSGGEYLLGAGPNQSSKGERIGVPAWRGTFDSLTQSIFMRYRYLGVAGETQEIRIYLNVKPAGIVDLLKRLSDLLTIWDIPFTIKCPAKRSLCERRDVVVLYLDRRNVTVACNLLFRLREAMKDYFVDDVPLFALRIAPGVAFAESPHDGSSFGMSRSEVCARGLVEAAQRDDTLKTRVACMLDAFDRSGISIERPHLNPSSHFPYLFGHKHEC